MPKYKELVKLQAFQLQQFSQNEIVSMIPDDVLGKIKESDPRPFFKAYSICHDGESSPKLLTSGKHEKIHWTKAAVQSLKNVIKTGIKFFHRHNADNSTEGRKDLGEIIAHEQKDIDGKLHQIAIGYFPPETRDEVKAYDICSHEGEWWFLNDLGKKIATGIEKLTGIALSSSSENVPAFGNTGELGAVQCFDAGGEPEKNGGEPNKLEGRPIMTLREVTDYIQENKVHIGQLNFTIDDVKSDRVLGKMFETLENENLELKKQTDLFANDKKGFEEKIKEHEAKENKILANVRFAEFVKDSKLGNKEKVFVETKFKNEEIIDLSENGIKQFVESKKEEFKLLAPLFEKAETFEANTGTSQPGDDYTKAANNPMLDEDYNPYAR